jgi:quinoprotein glucose dehydrogenase
VKSISIVLATLLISFNVPNSHGQQADEHPQLVPFRWSGELNIPDPVAISLDDDGAAYVTQTQRRKSQDLDIRNNLDWIPFDVGLRSVEEKRIFFRQQLSPERGQTAESKRRVQDMNRDGSHDYLDLRVLSERIYRIQDKDRDGTADSSELFADDFQTEVTGIGAGVLAFDDFVYATIAPDVWRLQDTNGDGRADSRQVLATGFGLHIAYAGHDMHGLTVGPDGRLYWTVGDKGISVVDKSGQRWHFPNQGGVMRCDPDGFNFEVFAHGLRNVQELAFDQYGNLFGVDNDADQIGERERFVYIVQDMDAGWRCNYQYRGDGYNPWTAEGLWKTPFEGQPSYLLPPLGYALNGPAGFAFNPGTALSPDYQNYFFLTGAPNGDQVAFRLEPQGAAFRRIDEHTIAQGLPLVGINFGPDGGLYAVDWGGGYPLNQKGAIWRIDAPKQHRNPQRKAVETMLAHPISEASTSELLKRLGHPDQRIRLKAQFELVQRSAVNELTEIAQSEGELLSRIHAIWGLGQLMRAGLQEVAILKTLLTDPASQIKIQTCRLIRELVTFDPSLIMPLLESDDPHVVFHALMALTPHVTPRQLPRVIDLLAGEAGDDPYLRHAATCVLANAENLEAYFDHNSPTVRKVIVVALRRLRDDRISRFLSDTNSSIVAEAARGIYDDESIPQSLPDLAAMSSSLKTRDPAIALRVIYANLRLGKPTNAENLLHLAADQNAPLRWRMEALNALSDFREPAVLDHVDGRNRQLEQQPIRTLPQRTSLSLSKLLLDDEPEMQRSALRTMRQLKLPVDKQYLAELILDTSAPASLRLEGISVFVKQDPEENGAIAGELLGDEEIDIRIAALSMIASRDEARAIKLVQERLSSSAALRERQHAVSMLGRLKIENARPVIENLLEQLSQATLPKEIMLELFEVVETIKNPKPEWQETLADWERMSRHDPQLVNIGEFVACEKGGDAELGEKLFMTHVTAACVRCHQIGDRGQTVGPNLAGIGNKKATRYLLRSIVAPSADIDPNYQAHVVQLVSGETVQGLLKSDDGTTTILFDSTGKEVKVLNADIDEAGPRTQSIMPEMRQVLTKREIRDLVAYLESL